MPVSNGVFLWHLAVSFQPEGKELEEEAGAGLVVKCDAVVVGSGGGAGPCAAQLAAAGLRVVILEKGDFTPNHELSLHVCPLSFGFQCPACSSSPSQPCIVPFNVPSMWAVLLCGSQDRLHFCNAHEHNHCMKMVASWFALLECFQCMIDVCPSRAFWTLDVLLCISNWQRGMMRDVLCLNDWSMTVNTMSGVYKNNFALTTVTAATGETISNKCQRPSDARNSLTDKSNSIVQRLQKLGRIVMICFLSVFSKKTFKKVKIQYRDW